MDLNMYEASAHCNKKDAWASCVANQSVIKIKKARIFGI